MLEAVTGPLDWHRRGTLTVPARDLVAQEDAMAMVTDLVCGMRIDPDDAAATAQYEGETYYFCSQACHDAFVADPASFVG